MKLVISPAKSLNYESALPTTSSTDNIFLSEAQQLNRLLKKKSVKALSELMHISPNLGQLNYERNQEWSPPFTAENTRPAIYAFSGDVYRGIDAYSIPISKLDILQHSVRIISGLYGLLKPLDLMQPYRLEMGTKLSVGKSKNLYEFWRKKVTTALNEELEEGELFVNLASQEYFKAIDVKTLKVPVIHVDFKEFKNGQYKTIAIFAKLARGYMTRHIIDNVVETVEGLKTFTTDGYAFDANLSTDTKLVFTR
ncbi:MAG: peroxide stress protein YaaA [Flavobacteriaceae bacterium]|nr:peroxide stress protein YaaA [Flavobacteriaceae bacterium]